MTAIIRNPLRVNLSREEVKQIKVKAAENEKSMAQFVADHLRESLRLSIGSKRKGKTADGRALALDVACNGRR